MKKLLKFLVVLIILVAIGIGGYSWYASSQNKKSFSYNATRLLEVANVKETEREKLERLFPKEIDGFEREDIPYFDELEARCEKIEDHPDSKGLGVTGEICMKMIRFYYRDKSSTQTVAVIAENIVSGKEVSAQLLSKVVRPEELLGYKIFRIEHHEIGWYPTSDYDLFITQEFKWIESGNSYDAKAPGNNPVTKYFLEKFPPEKI